MRSGTSLLMIAAIPLCLPIIAPAPSVTQLFIFFNSIWHSWTIFLRHLASSSPVAPLVMCCVCKKSVCGFPLELTYLTKTTNCWRTEISVTSSARQPNASEEAASVITLFLTAFPRKRNISRIEALDLCLKCLISSKPSLSNNSISCVAFLLAISSLANQYKEEKTFTRTSFFMVSCCCTSL